MHKFTLCIKGDENSVFLALQKRNVRIIESPISRNKNDAICTVYANLDDIVQWFEEETYAPHPIGTLLFYNKHPKL